MNVLEEGRIRTGIDGFDQVSQGEVRSIAWALILPGDQLKN